MPIFTKLGCNSGGCHGKASGQNGFKLSLLGFYPDDDYEFLVKEGRGRRLFPASPDQSLLLTKPIGKSPHGGGKRMDADSYEYRLIYRWIEQGMPYGKPEDPHRGRHQMPARRPGHGSRQPSSRSPSSAITATASTEDVTRMALFEANDPEMAEVNVTGLVQTLDLAGEVAIMARYQGQVATFRATIPLGAEMAERPPVEEFHRRSRVRQAEAAGHSAVAALRRRHVPPPGLHRHHRHHADRSGSPPRSSPTRTRTSATS